MEGALPNALPDLVDAKLIVVGSPTLQPRRVLHLLLLLLLQSTFFYLFLAPPLITEKHRPFQQILHLHQYPTKQSVRLSSTPRTTPSLLVHLPSSSTEQEQSSNLFLRSYLPDRSDTIKFHRIGAGCYDTDTSQSFISFTSPSQLWHKLHAPNLTKCTNWWYQTDQGEAGRELWGVGRGEGEEGWGREGKEEEVWRRGNGGVKEIEV